MNKVVISVSELGPQFVLSPEYWLSFTSSQTLEAGDALTDIVDLERKGTSTISATALVLDTGNTDRGLLTLPFDSNSGRSQRTSHKKFVPEGAVLISRLRPYLQQIAYIPHGTSELLGVSEILCSTEYYVLVPKESTTSIAFIVPWLLSREVQAVFQQATTGGHHPRFNEELLLRLSVPRHLVANRDTTSRQVDRLVRTHLNAQLAMSKLVSEASSPSSSSSSIGNPSNPEIDQGVG